MNQHLQIILNLTQQAEHLTEEEKTALLKAAKNADKELEITAFKLERTEKVKKTTAILLEETIEELEQKRKAVEAQNRELEIEAVLEKVRSRSLAVHKSNEFNEVVAIVFEKLQELGIVASSVSINIFIEDSKDTEVYICGQNESGLIISHFRLFYFDHPISNDRFNAQKSGLDFFSKTYGLEEKNSFYEYEFEVSDLKNVPDDIKKMVFESTHYTISLAIAKHSMIVVNDFEGKTLSEKEIDIVKRFSRVFEQAYTRFLDLQKAEAQVRESQIQLALERVRARTMAMQLSDELSETASEMFRQIQLLGLKTWSCGFNIIDKEKRSITQWVSTGDGRILPVFVTPSDENVFQRFTQAAQKDKSFYVEEMGGEVLKEHYQYMASLPAVKRLLDEFKSLEITPPDFQVFHLASFSCGYLMFITYQPAPEFYDVFKRFATVFDQTYRRFLDLKKAEAQARESQIQLALERVRARTMAMQKSDELREAVLVIYEQLQQLGFSSNACNIIIIDEKSGAMQYWVSGFTQEVFPKGYHVPYFPHPYHDALLAASRQKKKYAVIVYSGKMKKSFDEIFFTQTDFKNIPEEAKKFMKGLESVKLSTAFFSVGALQILGPMELTGEKAIILQRFAKVFEQTYTRFLDLQKAEAQAREATIEAALERVRSRTMAMQRSSELQGAALLLFQQVAALGVPSFACGFNIWDDDRKAATAWMAGEGRLQPPFKTSSSEDVFLHIHEAAQRGEQLFIAEQGGEELENHYRYMATIPEFKTVMDKMAEAGLAVPTFQIMHCAFFSHGYLMFISFDPVPEAHDIFKRFAKVFEQTYTRFLDLKKAEGQAREAQIEAALERVRSRTMGMQKSEELKEVIQVVYEQFVHLNINTEHTGFVMDYKVRDDRLIWVASKHGVPSQLTIPYFDSEYYNRFNEAKEKGWDFFATNLSFEEKNGFYQELFTYIPDLPDEAKEFYFNCPGLAISTVLLENVGLYIENFEGIPYSDEDNATLMRFGKVFQQTYTRFLDLQKAEAQAREAKIEAALDRVRSVAMSMMKSDELQSICESVFKQLHMLGFTDVRAAQIYIRDDAAGKFLNYDYSDITGADIVEVNYNSHPNTRRIYDVIRNAGDALVENVITKQELDEWKSYLYNALKQPPEKSLDNATELHYYLYSFGMGAFGICTFKSIKDDELQILKRFRNVFSLSYKRYTDIALAEAQAREAKIEAALERVRSRTLAMQKSDELVETAAVLFKQLILLGIEPNRLYISIMKDDEGETEFWITDEDGSKVSSAFESNMNDNPSFKKMYQGWKEKKKSLVIDMKGEELQEYFQHLGSLHVPFKDGLAQKRRLQYIGYFNKGFIGMASPDEQPEETVFLLERFAAVFNLTFTRFNDLKIAEAHAIQAKEDLIKLQTEKRRAEDALSELKETQKQLIQSEKMASLGELTAGIAHEIQNPLNFVNNFSEVNKEMIDEATEEIDKGNIEEVKNILSDIKDNSEKINHHGKRAEVIVKGMLQHSRKSEGTKEPTDINALCDEYLRLSYHGLRAKDKEFNADFKTDFDESLSAGEAGIGKINIVPQDIGRVLLNLYNNAFYATNQKQKDLTEFSNLSGQHFAPKVTVVTKKLNDKIEIIISDNGNGIPQNIVDKIFQPFFTTKPTGQGTGLGLSLSYDIIKAHGGEIKVETKEGEGAEFAIQLPNMALQ